jgi:cystathionine beta-lyase/cystathionine gamma-synthase
MGLKRYIMRLSVGAENPDNIIKNLASGLNAVAALNS